MELTNNALSQFLFYFKLDEAGFLLDVPLKYLGIKEAILHPALFLNPNFTFKEVVNCALEKQDINPKEKLMRWEEPSSGIIKYIQYDWDKYFFFHNNIQYSRN